MEKTDVANAVAEKINMSRWDAINAVDAMLEVITESLQKGEQVRFYGFGTFLVKQRTARVGRAPDGQTLYIDAARIPVFSADRTLKSLVDY